MTRRLSENGFVARLSEHFDGKAERPKTFVIWSSIVQEKVWIVIIC